MLQLPLPSIWSLFVLNMYLLYTPYFHVLADSNSVSCTRVCTCTYTCLCTDALVDVWQNGWLKSNWHSPWLLELVAIIVELMWNVTYMYIYLLYTYNMCTCMYLWGCWYWCITTCTLCLLHCAGFSFTAKAPHVCSWLTEGIHYLVWSTPACRWLYIEIVSIRLLNLCTLRLL